MMFMLDTDTFSNVVKGHTALHKRIAPVPPGDIKLSLVVQAEVLFGMQRSPLNPTKSQRIATLLAAFEILPLTQLVAVAYSSIRALLRMRGTPIGPNDLWIAAHALSEGATLVTGNPREFARVDGLNIENRLEGPHAD